MPSVRKACGVYLKGHNLISVFIRTANIALGRKLLTWLKVFELFNAVTINEAVFLFFPNRLFLFF